MKVLLADTSFSSIPIYEYLINSGMEVFIIGNNKNDFMAKNCPNYINANYTDNKKLKEVLDNYKIDLLVPGCNDHSYEACSKLENSELKVNIDPISITKKLFNKKEFRNLAKKINLPIPKSYSLQEVLESKVINQLIIKPVDSFSGKGISKLDNNNREQTAKLIEYAIKSSKEGKYIIEDYVEGNLYSHSAFIENKKIIKDFIVNEYSTVNPFVVDTSYVNYNFPENLLSKIRNNIEKIAFSLNLVDGLIHTQFIRKKDNYWLIEITRRCPGDLYSQLITLSTGYPYAEKYTSYFVNKIVKTNSNNKRHILRHTITQNEIGIFKNLKYNKKLNIINEVNISSVGDLLQPSPLGRVKIIFIKNKSKEKHEKTKELLISKKAYKIHLLNTQVTKSL